MRAFGRENLDPRFPRESFIFRQLSATLEHFTSRDLSRESESLIFFFFF